MYDKLTVNLWIPCSVLLNWVGLVGICSGSFSFRDTSWKITKDNVLFLKKAHKFLTADLQWAIISLIFTLIHIVISSIIHFFFIILSNERYLEYLLNLDTFGTFEMKATASMVMTGFHDFAVVMTSRTLEKLDWKSISNSIIKSGTGIRVFWGFSLFENDLILCKL